MGDKVGLPQGAQEIAGDKGAKEHCMRYDDIDQDYIRRKRERRQKMKLALILTLLSMIGFVVMLIYLDGKDYNSVSDAQKTGVGESFAKNGEITSQNGNDSMETQESLSPIECVDGNIIIREGSDGGVWVISAFPVPAEWRKEKEVTDEREQP